MYLASWQYYPKWHLSYKKSRYDYLTDSWWEYFICIGPFQMRWWGKVWPKLQRPPQYSARVKEILLEDLKTINHGDNHVQLSTADVVRSTAEQSGPDDP